MKIDLTTPVVQAMVIEPAAYAFKPEEVKLNQGDPLYMLHDRSKQYAGKFSYDWVISLQEALLGRQAGKLVLSFREADIAARGEVDLSKEVVKVAIRLDGWMLTEGVAGCIDSAWELRSFYNRGIQFFASGKVNHVDATARHRAKAALDNTRFELSKLKLPLWPEEEAKGFPLELCKPDYMTWDQYRQRMRNPITIESNHAHEKDNTNEFVDTL